LAGGDVDGHEELLEVEEPVPVGVENPHDVAAELVPVTCNRIHGLSVKTADA